MRIIIGFLFLIGLIACKQNETTHWDGFTIEGIIESPSFDKFMVSDISALQPLPNIACNATTKGYVGDTMFVDKKGFYLANYGDESFIFYAEPSQHIRFQTQGKSFKKSLKFENDLADQNNFLLSTNKVLEDTLKNLLKDSYVLDEKAFLNRIDSINQLMETIINENKPKNENTLVTEFIRSNVKLELHTFLLQYPEAHAIQTENAQFQPSESFISKIQKIPEIKDSMIVFLPNYRQLILGQYQMPLQESIKKNKKALQDQTTSAVYLFLDLLDKDSTLSNTSRMKKDYLIGTFAAQFDYLPENKLLKQVNDSLQKVIQTPVVKKELQSIYDSLHGLEVDSKAPSVAGKDVVGKDIQIALNKPTLLYFYTTADSQIDQQKGLLDSLHHQYQDSIQIVGLNLDLKKDWDFYRKKTPIAYQDVHLSKRYHSETAKQYGVQLAFLPKMVLIDKESKIKNPQAPPLGSAELSEQIKQLIQQIE